MHAPVHGPHRLMVRRDARYRLCSNPAAAASTSSRMAAAEESVRS